MQNLHHTHTPVSHCFNAQQTFGDEEPIFQVINSLYTIYLCLQ